MSVAVIMENRKLSISVFPTLLAMQNKLKNENLLKLNWGARLAPLF
ncbi:hypothetical protein XBKB1_2370005 [Xenorhabdus bovienii str. kraussei Becker Underwood]|uniref:Uncharacterized protein n=1 Tax=Xenorhabdus bovienii str. kraussei Becker Underwood TaxID=1398204 RepID=A0A077PI83_XENBV|nr:hypothetical protein XBKB1_2370005 [Xenorhabdus bovienii str. kraussei Becker Underwood]